MHVEIMRCLAEVFPTHEDAKHRTNLLMTLGYSYYAKFQIEVGALTTCKKARECVLL